MGVISTELTSISAGLCSSGSIGVGTVFWLFLLVGGMLLLRFGSKATTWWSLNLCGCSWGSSVLSWILLLDWLDGWILVRVYCCPIEVWYIASWNTLFAESPFFAEFFIFINNLFRQCNLLHICDVYH